MPAECGPDMPLTSGRYNCDSTAVKACQARGEGSETWIGTPLVVEVEYTKTET